MIALWRQDDHGNRFLVGVFPTRELAEERLAALTRCPHKQTYWLSAEQPTEAVGNDGNTHH